MSKRKTLGDLRPRDEFYIVDSRGLIEVTKIDSVGSNMIVAVNNYVTIQYSIEDLTCWQKECELKHGKDTIAYFNKIDAFKQRKKILEEKLVDVFKQQKDFLEQVKDLNDLIYKCNIDIVYETKKL